MGQSHFVWCGREDSNLHSFRNQVLNREAVVSVDYVLCLQVTVRQAAVGLPASFDAFQCILLLGRPRILAPQMAPIVIPFGQMGAQS